MLTMAIMLAVISTMIEMFFVIQYETIRKFMVRFQRLGLTFSLVFSYCLGTLFGAEGLISMFGAILSTIISYGIYESGALKYAEPSTRAELAARFRKAAGTCIGTIKWWGHVISAPFRGWRWLKGEVKQSTAKIKSYGRTIKRVTTRAKRAI